MRVRFLFSWLVLLAGAGYGAHLSYTGQNSLDPLVSTLSTGYMWWAIYWGLPAVLLWWWRYPIKRQIWPMLLKWCLGLALLPWLISVYSILGGGLYQCLKVLWAGRR